MGQIAHDWRTDGGGSAFSRRLFLAGAATLGAGGVLAGCTVRQEADVEPVVARPILPGQQTGGTPPVATPVPGGLDLEAFLALSSVLTGFADLNPDLGRIYLASLEARPNPPVSLLELYERAGFRSPTPPDGIDDLEGTGIFGDEATRGLADTIITYWYTGIHDAGGQEVVATYVDALVWQAIEYTKPRTICGPFPGFWRERPPVIP